MLHYKFPRIETLADVLPHIQTRTVKVKEVDEKGKETGEVKEKELYKEFKVTPKGDYAVVNYKPVTPESFSIPGLGDEEAGIDGGDDASSSLGGRVRRECRGLIFENPECSDKSYSPEGKLISRPFHKFFNIGEPPYMTGVQVDMNIPHTIMEKLDGSMIRPLYVGTGDSHDPVTGEVTSYGNQGLRLATKMGITEVSNNAEAWLWAHPNFGVMRDWLVDAMMMQGMTPIFEWISRENRIVVDYPESDLVLLAVRVNTTGEYLDIYSDEGPDGYDWAVSCPFNKCPIYGSFGDRTDGKVDLTLDDYITRIRESDEDREGDVIRFHDGSMVKLKSQSYLRMHRAKDATCADRKIIDLAINEEVDDVLPVLPADEADAIVKYVADFWASIDRLEGRIEGLMERIRKESPLTKETSEFFDEDDDGGSIAHARAHRKWVATDFRKSLDPATGDDQLMNYVFRQLPKEVKPKEVKPGKSSKSDADKKVPAPVSVREDILGNVRNSIGNNRRWDEFARDVLQLRELRGGDVTDLGDE